MIWKKHPHLPEVGAKIYGILKNETHTNRFYEISVQDNTSLSHVEKWCYKEEMIEIMNRKLFEVRSYGMAPVPENA